MGAGGVGSCTVTSEKGICHKLQCLTWTSAGRSCSFCHSVLFSLDQLQPVSLECLYLSWAELSPPWNSLVEVLKSSASECDCTWWHDLLSFFFFNYYYYCGKSHIKHTILTTLNWSVQGHQVYSQYHAPLIIIHLRIFNLPKLPSLASVCIQHPFSPHPCPGHLSMYFQTMNLTILGTSHCSLVAKSCPTLLRPHGL